MRQVRSVVVELDPTNHAVILQILRNFRLSDPQMFRQLRLQPAIHHGPALPRSLRRAAPRTSRQIPQSYAQGLTSFHIVRSDLIRIRQEKHARTSRRGIRIIQFMQRARHQPPEHGIKFCHPRSQRWIARASVRGAFRGQHRFGKFDLQPRLSFFARTQRRCSSPVRFIPPAGWRPCVCWSRAFRPRGLAARRRFLRML
jgi:hypothetical protein